MQRIDGQWIYSATDLNNFLECRRLPELELLVALGKRVRPNVEDEQAELVRKKGDEHELRHLETLRTIHGQTEIVEIPRPARGIEAYQQAEAQTITAMRTGAKIIYQATFFDGEFVGHADFLERVDGVQSNLGNYVYEAADTKLALSTKPYFIIQLCNYSEHLARVQGVMPKTGRIVFGDGRKLPFKLNDYMAYYRHVKKRFLEEVARKEAADITEPANYPLETEHCMVCPWDGQCEAKRRVDDHLSLVAWMRRDQTIKLEANGVTTVEQLADASDDARPREMAESSFRKLRKQAQLQIESRRKNEPVHELLPNDPRAGFGLLPEPAVGDVYFDMEGDPMYEPHRGLEYLFGVYMCHPEPVEGCLSEVEGNFKSFWALNRAEEKRAFERFIDFIVERRKLYPKMHVYHYANYEKAALQRLSQQHSTRGQELDDLLRSEVLVDLYAVVRQAMMIGEESYSIKKLERFYGFSRDTGVKRGDASIVEFEEWRVTQEQAILDDIEAYNKDDCESTWHLHRWLLDRRDDAIAKYGEIPWRPLKTPKDLCHDEPFEGCSKCRDRVRTERDEQQRSDLERELLRGVIEPETDDEYYNMGEPMRSRYLLGHALSYHRREANPVWWEYFRRCENVDELLDQDGTAIAGLQLDEAIAPYKNGSRDRNLVYTYRFPEQRHKMEAGTAYDPATGDNAGAILAIDDDRQTLLLKRSGDINDARKITALIPGGPPDTTAPEVALTRIAEAFVAGTLREQFPATADMLESAFPRFISNRATDAQARSCHAERSVTKQREAEAPQSSSKRIIQPKTVTTEALNALVRSLDHSYLFIQGPPGTGKSTYGSEVIADLLRVGKRVGVMSRSHKAAHNLLHKVEECAFRRGETYVGFYKHTDDDSRFISAIAQPFIESTDSNNDIEAGSSDIAGGTVWLFSRPQLASSFDYLFIDEAGQVSFADALAASLCAKNIVLLGDPSQLAQVSKGCHAPHCDDSVLEHLLGRGTTIACERGVFLDVSYRMQPEICSFVSDTMYDGRLRAAPSTYSHSIVAPGLNAGGLHYVAVQHHGHGSTSNEEAEQIVLQVASLLRGKIADDGIATRFVTDDDIIVVAPFNAQRRIVERNMLTAGFKARVGTVDKFQGQEAPIVFYSLATSSLSDAHRGFDFILDASRFNVAISRARVMAVIVCSPELVDSISKNVDEIRAISRLCDYLERAVQIQPLPNSCAASEAIGA